MEIKKGQEKLLNAMGNIFYGGEFAEWLGQQNNIPWAAMREYDEAFEWFCSQTGFEVPSYEDGQ